MTAQGDSDDRIRSVRGEVKQTNSVPDVYAETDFLAWVAGLDYQGADPHEASQWIWNEIPRLASNFTSAEHQIGGAIVRLSGTAPGQHSVEIRCAANATVGR
jgi:hypothetical protein